MSSKRGRKRNDNLPPNRARDVQRAFRARRAAHLQALEQRVTELEDENTQLRAALNLPPASRPSLGKGPTGKDRPRALDGDSHSYPSSAKSRESSYADMDSPGSTRNNSVSPSAMTSVRPSPRSAHPMDSGGAWDHALLMNDHADGQGGSTPYHLPPVSASVPQKLVQQYSFSNPMPPNTRNSMTSGMYMGSQQSQYSPTTERPMVNTYNNTGYIARDARDEQSFSYSQAQFPNHDSGISHSPTTSHHSQHHQSPRESVSAQSNPPYSQRRSNTEPHGFRALLNQPSQLPHTIQINNTIRLPSPTRPSDTHSHSHRPHPPYGGADGRLGSMS